jgi:hypothetical protein
MASRPQPGFGRSLIRRFGRRIWGVVHGYDCRNPAPSFGQQGERHPKFRRFRTWSSLAGLDRRRFPTPSRSRTRRQRLLRGQQYASSQCGRDGSKALRYATTAQFLEAVCASVAYEAEVRAMVDKPNRFGFDDVYPLVLLQFCTPARRVIHHEEPTRELRRCGRDASEQLIYGSVFAVVDPRATGELAVV